MLAVEKDLVREAILSNVNCTPDLNKKSALFNKTYTTNMIYY